MDDDFFLGADGPTTLSADQLTGKKSSTDSIKREREAASGGGGGGGSVSPLQPATAAVPASPPPPPSPPQRTAKAPFSLQEEVAALHEKAASAVAQDKAAIQKRIKEFDGQSAAKDAAQKKAAQEFLANKSEERKKKITEVKKLHLQQQAEFEKKRAEYSQSGALWSAVGMMLGQELSKPPGTINAAGAGKRSSERMRLVMKSLADKKE